MPYKTKESAQAYRDKNRDYMRKWRATNKEKCAEYNRAYRLRTLYGLTPSDWDAMFSAQGNCCAICKSPDPGSSKGRVTDHCHDTQKVRGILCNGCNVGIGQLRNDPTTLASAIEYLEANNVQRHVL